MYLLGFVFLGVVTMIINQISNTEQKNYSIYNKKNHLIDSKIHSILSQLHGKIRGINFQYNNNSIIKARITVVVSSKSEALKVMQSSDNEIDINVAIIKDSKNKEISDKTYKPTQRMNINEKTDKNSDYPQNKIYTYNRGPNGKIYGLIQNEKKTNDLKDILAIDQTSINDKLKNQYINIYKRYSFRNIKIKKNTFSLYI